MQLVSSTVPHSLGNGAVTKAEAFDRQDLINAFFGIMQEQSDDLSRKIVGFLDPRDANAVRCLNRRVSNIDKLTVESFESAMRFHDKQSEKLYDLLTDPAAVIDAHIQRAERAYKGCDVSQRDTHLNEAMRLLDDIEDNDTWRAQSLKVLDGMIRLGKVAQTMPFLNAVVRAQAANIRMSEPLISLLANLLIAEGGQGRINQALETMNGLIECAIARDNILYKAERRLAAENLTDAAGAVRAQFRHIAIGQHDQIGRITAPTKKVTRHMSFSKVGKNLKISDIPKVLSVSTDTLDLAIKVADTLMAPVFGVSDESDTPASGQIKLPINTQHIALKLASSHAEMASTYSDKIIKFLDSEINT